MTNTVIFSNPLKILISNQQNCGVYDKRRKTCINENHIWKTMLSFKSYNLRDKEVYGNKYK